MKILLKALSLLISFVFVFCPLLSCSNKKSNDSFIIPERSIEDNTIYEYGDFTYCIYNDNTAVIAEYKGSDQNVTIPSDIEGNKVVSISPGAFSYNTTIISVTLPESVEIIGEMAFDGCTSLKTVNLGNKVWSIGPDAFNETLWENSLTDEFVILGDSLLFKYNGADSNVTIPDNIKHIGPAFFNNQNIANVTIGDNVYTLGSGAFLFSSVSSVSIGENIVLIDTYAFQGCQNLRDINIPNSVKTISHFAFYGCSSLTHIKLGTGVESIYTSAFESSSQLRYIMLPRSLKNISVNAFKDCNNLAYVYYEGSESEFEAIEKDNTNYLISDAKKFYEYNYNGENDGTKK
jgi:hypothetical protein